jgi:hypothetical protein
MYERIDVWKRAGTGIAIRFQCLRRMSDGLFAVQNADSVRVSALKTDLQGSDATFVELFVDEDPTDRCDWYPSLAEAIASHEKDFSGMPGNPYVNV